MIVELRRWSKAPIIVLSGRTSPGDKIGALDVGADDYVTKPFAMAELLARLRAALRRDEGKADPGGPRQAMIGHWLVDLSTHQVTRAAGPATVPTTGPSPADPGSPPRPGSGGGGPDFEPERRCGSRRPSGGSWNSCCRARASSSGRRRS